MVGWSEGAGKLSVPGRPTSLDDSRARAYCVCNRCGLGLSGHFFSYLSFLFSFSLSLGDDLKSYCLKGPSSPKQLTKNRPFVHLSSVRQVRSILKDYFENCVKYSLCQDNVQKSKFNSPTKVKVALRGQSSKENNLCLLHISKTV